MSSLKVNILWRQDWFVVGMFNEMVKNPGQFTDRSKFQALQKQGEQFKQQDRIEQLRNVVFELFRLLPAGEIAELFTGW